jgi:tagatose-1,6-bisphosphate aldolase
MVALDQRESLRTTFTDALGHPVGDQLLVDFKLRPRLECGRR